MVVDPIAHFIKEIIFRNMIACREIDMDTIGTVHQHRLKAQKIIDALWEKSADTVIPYHFYNRSCRDRLIKSNGQFVFI